MAFSTIEHIGGDHYVADEFSITVDRVQNYRAHRLQCIGAMT
ncbi:hypothetical protein ACL9RL_09445 [Plantibacter sp. Mn2098]